MIRWLKTRILSWLEECQRRESARLRTEALRLKDEIERTTGQPIQLTAEDRQRLAESAKGIDPERLEEISAIDPKKFMPPHHDDSSTENP